MSGKRLSVLVPVRDAAATLPALLDSLSRQADPAEIEVLVLDDGSTDDTVEVLARYPGVRHLRLGARRGVPAALNAGVEAASAPIVALTDGDCVPAEDWVAAGLAAFDRDPEAAVVAGEVTIALTEPNLAGLVNAATFLDQERFVREGHFATANVWLTREALARAGRFDETIEWGCFDTEYGFRLGRAGFRPRYAPEVVVHHPPRPSLRALAKKARRVGRGRAQIGAPPMLSSPRGLLPSRSLRGKERLARLGVEVGPGEELRVSLAQYFSVHLPMLLAETAEARRRRVGAGGEAVR